MVGRTVQRINNRQWCPGVAVVEVKTGLGKPPNVAPAALYVP